MENADIAMIKRILKEKLGKGKKITDGLTKCLRNMENVLEWKFMKDTALN